MRFKGQLVSRDTSLVSLGYLVTMDMRLGYLLAKNVSLR